MLKPTELTSEEVQAIIRLIPSLCDFDGEVTKIDLIKSISPNDVYAYCWNPRRLNRSLRLFAEGKRPPAILVTGYEMEGKTYYIPTDGNHRTLAYRQLRQAKIRANIDAICYPKPKDYVIHSLVINNQPRRELWKKNANDGFQFLMNLDGIEWGLAKQLKVVEFNLS